MKTRPINFKAHEVRATREGRKTQTRRIVQPQPRIVHAIHNDASIVTNRIFRNGDQRIHCPYGQPGDRLLVRETWQHCQNCGGVDYAADVNKPRNCRHCDASLGNWKPSILMFRVSSRITLEIVSVRVERLRDISEKDAMAEGVYPVDFSGQEHPDNPVLSLRQYRAGFEEAWEHINGTCSWDLNPWVWVVEFKEVK